MELDADVSPEEARDNVGQRVAMRNGVGEPQGEGTLHDVQGWTGYVEQGADVLVIWHVGYLDPVTE